ncbi:integrase core domain-containing protein [Chloroflexi bacterium TSY]|nr:integrase core domain-containing protein [Chloroflexi bacterium TSY]
MEEQLRADRQRLRELLQEEASWTNKQLAELTGRSVGWVKKWKRRLAGTRANDLSALCSQSRRPQTAGSPVSQRVIDAILEIRDNPPENLGRIPGPRAILYYLHRNEELRASGDYLPTSTSTVWKILDENQRIWRPGPARPEPVERPEPMCNLQMDFKDVTTVAPALDGRRAHHVEVLNVIDVGTSVLLSNEARNDYNAETAIDVLATTFQDWGVPEKITFDRDPRFVGAAQSRDFPSATIRFLLCMGIEIDLCPPQRPDLNAFVERFHRTYEYECVRRQKPRTLEETISTNQEFAHHYNFERPNQALTCDNQPPRIAFPLLPERPALPEMVDPDRWLFHWDNRPLPLRDFQWQCARQ